MNATQARPVLGLGDQLVGAAVDAPLGGFAVMHQGDGDVVVYDTADGTPVWSTATALHAAGGRLELGADGRLVVLDSTDHVAWSPPESVAPADHLVLGDDGALALLASGLGTVWTSHAPRSRPEPPRSNRSQSEVLRRGELLRHGSLRSPSGEYAFTVEDTGCARLTERSSGRTMFEMGPREHLAGLCLGDDGTLAWRTVTGTVAADPALDTLRTGREGSELHVTESGEVRLCTSDGATLWCSTWSTTPGATSADARITPRG